MSKYNKISSAIKVDISTIEDLLASGVVTLYDVLSHNYINTYLSRDAAKNLMYKFGFDIKYIDPNIFDIFYDITYVEYHSNGYGEIYNHLLDYEKVFQYLLQQG